MNPGTSRPGRRETALIAAGAACVSAATLASAWHGAGGHFMLPLDDSYIHLQYARMLAEGHPYVYSPGTAPSGGATSPAWVALLSPAFLLGAKGVVGAVWSYVLSTLIFMGSALAVRALVARLASPVEGLFAAALLILNGHLVWNFLSGMETGLFTLLILTALLCASRWRDGGSLPWRRVGYVALALLPLARPEGFLVVVTVVGWMCAQKGESPRSWLFRGALLSMPGLLNLAALSVLTGEWKPAGMVAKGLFDRTDIGMGTKLWMMTDTFVAMPLRFYRNIVPDDGYAGFKGTDYMPYLPLGLPLLALLGGVGAMCSELRRREPGPLTLALAVWVVGILGLCAAGIPFIHQQRYAAPWTAVVIVLACVTAHRLRGLAKTHEFASAIVLTTMVLLTLPSVPYWILEYGRNSRDIYRQHREMSFSVQPGERIAVTDTGVLVYYPQAVATDLVGLTSAQFTRPWISGESCVIEEMARLDPAIRPRTIITFREWFSPVFPLGPAEYGKFLSEPTISAQRYLARYPIEWRRIELGRTMELLPTDGIIAEVNVADLESERASGYRWHIDGDDERPKTWPRPLFPTGITPEGGVCGGRFVRSEEFSFEPPKGFNKRHAVLLARVSKTSPDASPVGLAGILEVEAISLDSGVGAKTTLAIPEAPPLIAPVSRLPLGDLLERAGGTRWRIKVRSSDSPGYGYLSHHYVLVESAAETNP